MAFAILQYFVIVMQIKLVVVVVVVVDVVVVVVASPLQCTVLTCSLDSSLSVCM